jgi:hypothetical protein
MVILFKNSSSEIFHSSVLTILSLFIIKMLQSRLGKMEPCNLPSIPQNGDQRLEISYQRPLKKIMMANG